MVETALAPRTDEARAAQREAADWLRSLAARTRKHLTDIAQAAGIAQSTLTQGVAGRRLLTRSSLMRVAAAFDVAPPADLLARLPQGRERGGAARSAARRSAARFVLHPEQPALAGRVRLIATPSDLPPPFFYLNFDVVTDTAPRPPGIADARNVYAFRMPEDGMAPWRRRKQLVYVDPGRTAGPGDHVLLRLAPLRDPNGMDAFVVALFEDLRGPGGRPRFLRYDHPGQPYEAVGWRVSEMRPVLEIDDLLGS